MIANALVVVCNVTTCVSCVPAVPVKDTNGEVVDWTAPSTWTTATTTTKSHICPSIDTSHDAARAA